MFHNFFIILFFVFLSQARLEIVDTPGFDENEQIEQDIFLFMGKPVAHIFLIDAAHAGGMRGNTQNYIEKVKSASKINKSFLLCHWTWSS